MTIIYYPIFGPCWDPSAERWGSGTVVGNKQGTSRQALFISQQQQQLKQGMHNSMQVGVSLTSLSLSVAVSWQQEQDQKEETAAEAQSKATRVLHIATVTLLDTRGETAKAS
jgi:hypothetical protein